MKDETRKFINGWLVVAVTLCIGFFVITHVYPMGVKAYCTGWAWDEIAARKGWSISNVMKSDGWRSSVNATHNWCMWRYGL